MTVLEEILAAVDAWPHPGLAPSDLLLAPDPLRKVLTRLLRSGGASADEIAADLGLEASDALEVARRLVVAGVLEPPDDARHFALHRVTRARGGGSAAALGRLLEDGGEPEGE